MRALQPNQDVRCGYTQTSIETLVTEKALLSKECISCRAPVDLRGCARFCVSKHLRCAVTRSLHDRELGSLDMADTVRRLIK